MMVPGILLHKYMHRYHPRRYKFPHFYMVSRLRKYQLQTYEKKWLFSLIFERINFCGNWKNSRNCARQNAIFNALLRDFRRGQFVDKIYERSVHDLISKILIDNIKVIEALKSTIQFKKVRKNWQMEAYTSRRPLFPTPCMCTEKLNSLPKIH